MTTTPLPPDLTFGHVAEWVTLGVADGTDTGREPDTIAPKDLKVTFTPRMTDLTVTTPTPGRVWPQPVECSIDTGGYLVDPMGARGVRLFTGQWTVTYSHPSVPKMSYVIEVTTAHTETAPLHLSQAQPPGGATLTLSEYAALSARIDALEEAVISGVLDTGWVDITGSFEPGWSGTCLVRRSGMGVSVRFEGLTNDGTGTGNVISLPYGYRPGANNPSYGAGNTTGSQSPRVDAGVACLGGTLRQVVRVETPAAWAGGSGSVNLLTSDPFP